MHFRQKKGIWGLFLGIFSSFLPVLGQIEGSEGEMEWETLVENMEEEEIDWIQLAEELEYLREKKMNINTASAEELGRLPFLNPFQIFNFLRYRKAYGEIVSLYELQAIKGFDRKTILQMAPFIRFGDEEETPFSFKKMWKYGRHNSILRYGRVLEEREGYRRRREKLAGNDPGSTYFAGDPNAVYMRHRFSWQDRVLFGFTVEKDAGEALGGPHNPLFFDYASGHIEFRDFGPVKSLVLGDFQAQFGQGLALWSSMAFGKSAMSLNTQRFARTVFGYTGADENRFFRGAAMRMELIDIDITAFYSNKSVDAGIAERDSMDEPIAFSGLQQSGLHRTPSEIASKNALGIESLGGHLQRDFGHLRIGFTAVQHRFHKPLQPPDVLYRRHDIRGTESANISFDYQYLIRGMHFFGEWARDVSDGYALSNGTYVSVDDRLTFSLLHRSFSPEYRALYQGAFAESGSGRGGENGIYFGVKWELDASWVLHAYADHFAFRSYQFNAAAPSSGLDYVAQMDYTPNKKNAMYARFRYKSKEINQADTSIIRQVAAEDRHQLRYHFQHRINEHAEWASRVECTRYAFGDASSQYGWLVYQDFRYQFPRFPLKLTLRYALFDTDSYDARLYAYEHDVLYAFSIPAYFNQGSRTYILLQLKSIKNMDIWLRWAQTYYHKQDRISSGLNEIEGNTLTDIRLQLRWKF